MFENQNQRVRTVTWEDPTVSARDAGAMSGIDFLRSICEGRIMPPPISELVGYRLSEVEVGRAVFEIEPAEYHYNPFSGVHGGIAATLLDSAMSATVLSTLEAGFACPTLEIKVNFVRPITRQTGLLRCEGKIIYAGKRIATAEGRLVDGQGRLYAHATSTLMIVQTAPDA